uniref:Uncharacterized protein n=1 Tax=Arion vulgaris TaxID=1028688 RepID=A0A0B6XVS2_9EUPU
MGLQREQQCMGLHGEMKIRRKYKSLYGYHPYVTLLARCAQKPNDRSHEP